MAASAARSGVAARLALLVLLAAAPPARGQAGTPGFRDSLRYDAFQTGRPVRLHVEHLDPFTARLIRWEGDGPADTLELGTVELDLLPRIAGVDSIFGSRRPSMEVGVDGGQLFFGVSYAWPRVLTGVLALLLAGLVAVGYLRQRRTLRTARADLARARRTARLVEASREAERAALARDLHDGPLQDLAAARFGLYADPLLPLAAPVEALDERLGSIAHDLRALTDDLRMSHLADAGLASALRTLVQRRHPDLTLDLRFDDTDALPEALAGPFFRFAQEALANAVRHGRARRAVVALERSATTVRLSIEDDGAGMALPAAGLDVDALGAQQHFGLLGMRERVQLLGGRFDVQSTPGRGTRVSADVPLVQEGQTTPEIAPIDPKDRSKWTKHVAE